MKPPHVDHMFALNRGKSRSLHMFRRDAKQGSTLAGKGAGRLVAALVRLDVVVPRISSVTWVFYQQDFEDIIDKELLING